MTDKSRLTHLAIQVRSHLALSRRVHRMLPLSTVPHRFGVVSSSIGSESPKSVVKTDQMSTKYLSHAAGLSGGCKNVLIQAVLDVRFGICV